MYKKELEISLHFSQKFANFTIAFFGEMLCPIKGYRILSTARSRVENELWRMFLGNNANAFSFLYKKRVETVIPVYSNYKNLTQDWHTSLWNILQPYHLYQSCQRHLKLFKYQSRHYIILNLHRISVKGMFINEPFSLEIKVEDSGRNEKCAFYDI